ncbi:hypothetical protein AJ80_03369 [Polytolypa hystricis UAMH7299]|uniref:Uncharacterized protein n=1 Tax=Polytolypa hystricis (strain UAMH7299) TaxID=1447883 RepID=A0A2B7YKF5_POLH7|nr:hypothetical protein AJ80_03369 [Polytolypa hystricis UAMH7299]
MPPLSELTYSHDACIAAFHDCYSFLANMYLDESVVIEPPEGGWPNITAATKKDLGKTETVISLLRQPYIRNTFNILERVQGAPGCYFADWQALVPLISTGYFRPFRGRWWTCTPHFGLGAMG